MAVTLANDYNNESLSSYVKWLDIQDQEAIITLNT